MFHTIKSKIVIITITLLFFILLVLSSFTYIVYLYEKELIVSSCSIAISALVQDINKEVINIENNAKDLALLGEQYYYFHKNKKSLDSSVIKIFENYPNSLGGGIWFKPFYIDKFKKNFCIYAFRNENNNIIIDNNFETEDYNYLEQGWYKEITSVIQDVHNIEWSTPYYEKFGSNTLMITAGSGMYDDSGSLIGISTVDWKISKILEDIKKLKPTPNSFALFANAQKDYIMISTDPYLNNDVLLGKSLKNIPWYNGKLKRLRYITYHNKKYVPYVKALDNGMVIVVCVPKTELFYFLVKEMTILFLFLVSLTLLVSGYLYYGLNKNIIKPINKLISIANKISNGEEKIEIKLEKPQEFAKLASVYDQMTKEIRIREKEKEHLITELSVAKSIQESSLPNKFPPFPNIKEFDIFASMTPARDVGGDFYDFYFIDQNKFMFLIGDVSGKGIPAALFMMRVKTLINNWSQQNLKPKEFIKEINNKICSNNKNGFFVTMFAGIIDLTTGNLSCINCGHNPPIIKHENSFSFMKLNPNIILGAFDDADFEIYETKLNPSDIILLYTDGVTEALNENNELFGEQRLLKCMNSDVTDVKEIIENVQNNISLHIGKIPQSDDITLLAFKYNGEKQDNNMFKCDAKIENYKDFYTWLNAKLKSFDLPVLFINKVDMCAEEIFANITFYAYPDSDGKLEVLLEKEDNTLVMKFIDSGLEYNPLEKEDPDITLPPEERPLGGLGIFMVKQMADDIEYKRLDGQNVLKITYNI